MKAYFPNREVGAVGRRMKRSEATYLLKVSFSYVKRYPSMVPSIIN